MKKIIAVMIAILLAATYVASVGDGYPAILTELDCR